ncbi:RNA-directed DNA polymerase, eukaryota, reverse transcriptase zinc-binding domain protein [Tanacetum coccineum]
MPINRGLIQAIPTSLLPQPIGEATKASNLQRIPPGVQGRSHFTYFLLARLQLSSWDDLGFTILYYPRSGSLPVSAWLVTMAGVDVDTLTMEQYLALSRENQFFPLLLPDLQKGEWTDSPQELSIPDPPQKGLYPKVLPTFHDRKAAEVNKSSKQGRNEGPIPGMRPAQALTAIQTMADHSPKWHDGTTSRNIGSSSSKYRLATLEPKIEQLAKEIHSDKILYSSSEQIKTVTSDQETSGLNKLHGVSFISGPESNTLEVLQHQLPPKELNPGSFTLPCTISKFNFYAMADLGASINVMPRSIFEHLHLTSLKKTNMLCEMADMTKKAPLGIVENVLVKIDKILFPSDFVILDNTPSETTILERPFLATIHAEIDVRHTDISEPVKKALLKLWLIDCFQDNSAFVNNPTHRSFDDYKWEFNLEIDKLPDEYELGIGKKGYIFDNIWEYCNQVHNKNYEWHNYEFEKEVCEEIGIEDKDYHPPEVQVETFKVKKYSFEGGQSFICVTKDLDSSLPLGRKNGSKFKEMIRKEVENNKT